MDQIMKIVHDDMVITANTLFNMAAQAVSAGTVYYFGILLNSETKMMTQICLLILIVYYFIAFILTLF